MASDLAIIAGSGQLPVELAKAYPNAVCCVLEGAEHGLSSPVQTFSFNKLGTMFEVLQRTGIKRVVLAGGMSRPSLAPSEFDTFMVSTAPKLLAAFQLGDDALLRFVISMFEDQALEVIGVHELLPELTAVQGVLVGSIPEFSIADIAKADEIMSVMSMLDIGQGVVVENGLTLGIETLQGTDALLDFVGETKGHLRHQNRGVFVKRPKTGQDLRVDMPAIGPTTIRAVARAGLSGLVITPKAVLVLERKSVIETAKELGVFVAALDVTQ